VSSVDADVEVAATPTPALALALDHRPDRRGKPDRWDAPQHPGQRFRRALLSSRGYGEGALGTRAVPVWWSWRVTETGYLWAGPASIAYSLAAIKDWTFLLGPGWVVGWGNGLILGYMMYRTQLVPRAWTWLGLVGGPLIIISGTVVMFGGNPAASALKGPASIPEALWELFLGVYCTV
jgi:hypothetical protein